MRTTRYIVGIICSLALLFGQESPDSVTVGYAPAAMRKDFVPPMRRIAKVPAGTKVSVLRTRIIRDVKWYEVEYDGQRGWIADFTLKSEDTTVVTLEQAKKAVAPVESKKSAICEMDGVKGFRFGMIFDEARAVPLNWKYSSFDSVSSNLFPGGTDPWTLQVIKTSHETSFAGKNATGTLQFIDDSLMSIDYFFDIETLSRNKYIDVYYEIKSKLTMKYGKPRTEEYLTGIYRDEFPKGSRAGLALSMGEGKYSSLWSCRENNTNIFLFLSGDNYKLNLVLKYADRDYDLNEKNREKALLDEF